MKPIYTHNDIIDRAAQVMGRSKVGTTTAEAMRQAAVELELEARQREAPCEVPPQIIALANGTKVKIGYDMEGEIIAFEVRGVKHQQINYEVAWWNGRQREKQWLAEQEVFPVEEAPAHVKVGFRRHV